MLVKTPFLLLSDVCKHWLCGALAIFEERHQVYKDRQGEGQTQYANNDPETHLRREAVSKCGRRVLSRRVLCEAGIVHRLGLGRGLSDALLFLFNVLVLSSW